MNDQPVPGWGPPPGAGGVPPAGKPSLFRIALLIGGAVIAAMFLVNLLAFMVLIAAGGGDRFPGPTTIATVSIDNETADDVVVKSEGFTWVVDYKTQVTNSVGESSQPTVDIHILTAACAPLAAFTWTPPGSWLIRIDATGASIVSKDYQPTDPPFYPWVPQDTCGPG